MDKYKKYLNSFEWNTSPEKIHTTFFELLGVAQSLADDADEELRRHRMTKERIAAFRDLLEEV